jgi:hypothetical protein
MSQLLICCVDGYIRIYIYFKNTLPNDTFRSGEGEGQAGINQTLLKVTPANINGNCYSILRHKDYNSLLFS